MKVVVEIDAGRIGLDAAADLLRHVAENLGAIMAKRKLELYCDFGDKDKIGFAEFKMVPAKEKPCITMSYGPDGKWYHKVLDNGRRWLHGRRHKPDTSR